MTYIKSEDVAKMFNVDVRTIQNQAKKGVFPPNVCGRLGNQYIFNEEALIKFVFPAGA